MHTALLVAFVSACVLGVFAIGANLAVYVALRRQGVPFSFGLSGWPGYLAARCAELPPSRNRDHLLKLSRWSNIAFGLAFAGGIILGPLLANR